MTIDNDQAAMREKRNAIANEIVSLMCKSYRILDKLDHAMQPSDVMLVSVLFNDHKELVKQIGKRIREWETVASGGEIRS